MLTRRNFGLRCGTALAVLGASHGIACAQNGSLDMMAARRNRRMYAERDVGGGPVPVPVVPEVGGLFTRFEQPTVFFFIKATLAAEIRLTLLRDGQTQPAFTGSLGPRWAKGLHAVHFNDLGVHLIPDQRFGWTLDLHRPGHEPVQAGATIVYRRLAPALSDQLATLSPKEAITVLQRDDYWYDAFLVAMQAPTGEREELTRDLLARVHIDTM